MLFLWTTKSCLESKGRPQGEEVRIARNNLLAEVVWIAVLGVYLAKYREVEAVRECSPVNTRNDWWIDGQGRPAGGQKRGDVGKLRGSKADDIWSYRNTCAWEVS
jgi:hypothetical protein